MIIRNEQLDVFQPQANADFETRLVKYLRDRYGNTNVNFSNETVAVENLSPEILSNLVKGGIKRAQRYEITWESNLASFVVLMFVTAPNFDEHNLINELLKDENLAPDERFENLLEKTTDENWEEVEQLYDFSAWEID